MSIQKAYAFPHPPLAIAEIGKGDEKLITDTLMAFDIAAKEIAQLAPEVIVFVTPHNINYSDYIVISGGYATKGNFARFGVPGISFNVEYDSEFCEILARTAAKRDITAGTEGELDRNLDHGVMVPMYFIMKYYSDFKVVRVSQSGLELSTTYMFGECIRETAQLLSRPTVVVASADLSHKLEGSPYGSKPEGAEFDSQIVSIMKSADFGSLFKIDDELREKAAECGYRSYLTMAGCFDKQQVKAKLLSYEGPFGVGYAVLDFEPQESDESRNFREQYMKNNYDEAVLAKTTEDDYCKLARESLEYSVKNNEVLPKPANLPDEMYKEQAGVFVTIHKAGLLRGCIGTISPTKNSVVEEIIQNAISAGLQDPRFTPIKVEELDFLEYKVDVLKPAQEVSSTDELDVKKYGVIVSSGSKRGLLLPNLDGVDTIEQQLSIAKQKASINEHEKVKIERFEVVRHG
ncbi:MAG: AmmeMemoRadiSam system protein A [Oscillospiraceae bacterium]|nr:AmmeMemoRadiSam system protein A [Oscillospiraceae bacterium]